MPTASPALEIRIAREEWEFELVHRLNYRTFVEEIPQHEPNPERRLVDRFHADNTYLVAMRGRELVGMLALRPQRPFSLDAKVADLDSYLPPGRRPIEVRLLAIAPEARRGAVLAALLDTCVRHCLGRGFDLAVLSATTRQLKLYRHMGCVAFGSLVGSERARFQPMYLTFESLSRVALDSSALRSLVSGGEAERPEVNLLPGPVAIATEVREAFACAPTSHRSSEFLALMARVRSELCRLTNARDVQVLLGSGSLANDVVAAQLSLERGPGLVLSNGEFGERLEACARAARLPHDRLRLAWGETFEADTLRSAVARVPRGGWLWFVHHETSTGVLNPLDLLRRLAAEHELALCVDCVSSVGAVPVDLGGVHLATTASGKGLGGYPGLSMVFHRQAANAHPDRLPGYLDLGWWAEHDSVPFTHSSNLVAALDMALRLASPERFERIRANAEWLRGRLRELGLAPLAPDHAACAAIVTVALDPTRHPRSLALGEALDRHGVHVSYRSRYLVERNWIQAALLGDPGRRDLERLIECLDSASNPRTVLA